MKKWKFLVDCILLCCLLSLVACRFSPFNSFGESNENSTATVAGFTPQQIQEIVDDIKNNQATLPVSLKVPAYNFYRFDYSNAAGGHRGSTILSYNQAAASAPYGLETTARVLAFEAMKTRAGYSFDYFSFSDGLTKDRFSAIISAIAVQYADQNFLLSSPQNIGSTTAVIKAVDELVNGLPLPAKADFSPVTIASPALDLNLKPDFSDLPVTTLASLVLNEDLHNMYASMTVVGLANYDLFKSNVPAVSQARPSFRLHKTEADHNITRSYTVSLAPISADGSVTLNTASPPYIIPGKAAAQISNSSYEDKQRIAFTYQGDHGVSQKVLASSEKLVLAFTYRDLWKKNCDSSKSETEGPIAYLNLAGPQKFAAESVDFKTPATQMLCEVYVDNLAIATFTADQGTTITVDVPIPAGKIATLACSIIPPTAQIVETYARTAILEALASEVRQLDDLENAAWNSARNASTSVELADLGRTIFVPTMFEIWFKPKGTYVYASDPAEFTPAVFRQLAAPVTPAVSMNMNNYSATPQYAYSLPILPAPVLTGITTGVFNTIKTFSILSLAGETCEYSLDNGTTWNAYSGPVALSTEGTYQIKTRSKATSLTSAPVSVTIDTTAPLAPTISGISSGNFSSDQTFTVSGKETGGVLYYSLDNEASSAIYTAPVIITKEGTTVVTAWQVDAAGNTGARTEPVSLNITHPLPAPTVTAIQPATAVNNARLENVQISGTGFISGAIVTLTRSGQAPIAANPVAFNSSTLLSCTFELTGKATGLWNVEVTNPDGKTAIGTSLFNIKLPLTPPAAPTISGIATGTFNSAQTFTITAAQAGGSLEYSLNNGATWAAYTGAVALSTEGTSILTARQTDADGLIGSAAAATTVTIDLPAAAPAIAGIANGTYNNPQTFTITPTQAGGSLKYSIDNGGTWSPYTGPVTLSDSRTFIVTAIQTEDSGLEGIAAAAVTVTINLSANPPAAPTIDGITAGTFTSPQFFTVNAAQQGGSLEYSLDGGNNWIPYNEAVSLSTDGTSNVTARQIDENGIIGVAAQAIEVTIITTTIPSQPPAPTIEGLSAGTYSSPQSFTLSAAQPGGYLEYSLDGGSSWMQYYEAVVFDYTSTVTARQIDDNGIMGDAAQPIEVVIIIAPSPIPFHSPTISGITSPSYDNVTGPTFTVTAAQSGGSLEYSVDNGITWAPYTGPVSLLSDGAYTVTAHQLSDTGMVGFNATGIPVTVRVSPQAPTITGISDGGQYGEPKTLTVTGAQPGGTLQYSLDCSPGNTAPTWVDYTAPVALNTNGLYYISARQVTDIGTVGIQAQVISISINIIP